MTPEQFDALEIGQEVTLTAQTPVPSEWVLYVCEKGQTGRRQKYETLWLGQVGDTPKEALRNKQLQCRIVKNPFGDVGIVFALWSSKSNTMIDFPATLKHTKEGGTQ